MEPLYSNLCLVSEHGPVLRPELHTLILSFYALWFQASNKSSQPHHVIICRLCINAKAVIIKEIVFFGKACWIRTELSRRKRRKANRFKSTAPYIANEWWPNYFSSSSHIVVECCWWTSKSSCQNIATTQLTENTVGTHLTPNWNGVWTLDMIGCIWPRFQASLKP